MTPENTQRGGATGQGEKSFDDRVREIRNQRSVIDPEEAHEKLTSGVLEPGGELTLSSSGTAAYAETLGRKTKLPDSVLVCSECWVFYEHDDDWVVCPQCESQLTEADRA